MTKNKFLFLFCLVFVVGSLVLCTNEISAWNIETQTPSSITVIADGSRTYDITYDVAWINSTIDSKILYNNNSIINWINSVFVKLSDIVSQVGNWSADKINYPTLNILNNGSYFNTFSANYSEFLTHIPYTGSTNNFNTSYNITTSNHLIISNGTSITPHWNMYEDGNGTLVWEQL